MDEMEYDFTDSETFGATDIGQKRSINQDQFLIATLSKSMLVTASSLPEFRHGRIFGETQGQVLLVADGMGGHAAGEKASSLALQHLINRLLNSIHWFFQSDEDGEEEFVSSMQQLLRDAHERIRAESEENADQSGMGTTLTMAFITWPVMYVVHAGDSRCYLIRDGSAEQLTTDHTLARQMVEAGGMKPEDEATSKWSNVLWNVLGGNNSGELVAEVRRVDLQEGDLVILCSDGLYRYMDSRQLLKAAEKENDASVLCKQLIDFANHQGGEDNITVIVSRPRQTSASMETDGIVQFDPRCAETASDPTTYSTIIDSFETLIEPDEVAPEDRETDF